MTEPTNAAPDADGLLGRYRTALAARAPWEGLWQQCYDYALPQTKGFLTGIGPGDRRGDRLFDGTAADAVEQLAASLLAELTPPWSRWFSFAAGPDLGPAERTGLGPTLETMAAVAQAQFDRSNFAVEMHQSLLDLVTVGTASLLVEEEAPGAASALRFSAVPLADLALEEGPTGRVDSTFRRADLTLAELLVRFPGAAVPETLRREGARSPARRFPVVESVVPDGHAYRTAVVVENGEGAATLLALGRYGHSPYVNFRWMKTPGEVYGRSPVMKALPDIRTANKVVELVLKNASIAVSGIWQADDDGVLNPATIKLVPGAIIPKAVGSAGLTPLANPGRFDVSQLVLEDLRARIRHALLVDRLGQVRDHRMTATEVLERSAEMARLLGATFGRLQSELLTPLLQRAAAILRRRGELPDLAVDGRTVMLQYRSPLAQLQAQRDAGATLRWLEAAGALGPAALAVVDSAAAARWLGEAFGVPAALLRPVPENGTAAPAPT